MLRILNSEEFSDRNRKAVYMAADWAKSDFNSADTPEMKVIMSLCLEDAGLLAAVAQELYGAANVELSVLLGKLANRSAK